MEIPKHQKVLLKNIHMILKLERLFLDKAKNTNYKKYLENKKINKSSIPFT